MQTTGIYPVQRLKFHIWKKEGKEILIGSIEEYTTKSKNQFRPDSKKKKNPFKGFEIGNILKKTKDIVD
jgi:hypothetical protein